MTFLAATVIALTAIFCLALSSFAWQDIAIGLLLSASLVAVYSRAIFPRPLPAAGLVAHVVLFIPRYTWMLLVDILKGTWLVTTFVVGLRKLEHPGIVKIPIGNHSQTGVGIVGLLVTISPGSFLVDIDWEERFMLVHYIDASDPAQLRKDVEKYFGLWEYRSRRLDPPEAAPDA